MSIWQSLGYKTNPFGVKPLYPYYEDIKLFVGREKTIRDLGFSAFINERSLCVVTGNIGVGKTTFVNGFQYFTQHEYGKYFEDLDPPKLLISYNKVEVTENVTVESLLTAVTIAVVNNCIAFCSINHYDVPEKIRSLHDYFTRTYSVSGGSYGGGIGALGFSANVQTGAPSISQETIKLSKTMLLEIVSIVRDSMNLSGIIVVVNNLDIISKKTVARIMDEARDVLFDIDHLYWILIGNRGMMKAISAAVPRVSDYFTGQEVIVRPFSWEELKQVVTRRFDMLKIRSDAKIPFSDEAIRFIYRVSRHEVRETFKILSDIVCRVLEERRSLQNVDREQFSKLFLEYAVDRSREEDLAEKQKQTLVRMLEKTECRPRDFKEFGYTTSQGFISGLQGLVSRGLLKVEEKGQARNYSYTGFTITMALSGALGAFARDDAINKLMNWDTLFSTDIDNDGYQLNLFESEGMNFE